MKCGWGCGQQLSARLDATAFHGIRRAAKSLRAASAARLVQRGARPCGTSVRTYGAWGVTKVQFN
jgi:hypothetical protein